MCSILIVLVVAANDCFELGRIAYNSQDYYHTVLWIQEALNLYERELPEPTMDRATLLDYLAYATYMVSFLFFRNLKYFQVHEGCLYSFTYDHTDRVLICDQYCENYFCWVLYDKFCADFVLVSSFTTRRIFILKFK